MITLLSTLDGTIGCERFLATRGRSLATTMRTVAYEELPALRSLPACAAIFAAVDQLSPKQQEAATELWNQLSRAGQRVLNHPARSLRRHKLLGRLHALGKNRFRVFRGDESSKADRFPVFVRQANKHTGNLTPLLDTRLALDDALAWLCVSGFHKAHLLIVEYCDARDSSGLIRKYSAFKVGEAVVAKSLMFGSHWMVKSNSRLADDELDEARAHEALEYIQTNPHEPWIREIFELAQIDYGRIDYGFCDGAPQVWEINTDPTLAKPFGPPNPERERYRSIRKTGQHVFHRGFRAALRNLDTEAASIREIPILLPPRLRRDLRVELRRERVRRSMARVVGSVAGLPALRPLKDLLKPRAPALGPVVDRIPRWRAE